jgi:hypothetical protein
MFPLGPIGAKFDWQSVNWKQGYEALLGYLTEGITLVLGGGRPEVEGDFRLGDIRTSNTTAVAF